MDNCKKLEFWSLELPVIFCAEIQTVESSRCGQVIHLCGIMTQSTGVAMRTAVRTSYFAVKCEYLKTAFGPCVNDERGINSVQCSRTVWNIPWSMYKWTWFVTWGFHRATHKTTHSGLKAYFTARNKNPCRYILATSTWALDIKLPFCALSIKHHLHDVKNQ